MQEHWSGLPFPSPMHESTKLTELLTTPQRSTQEPSQECRLSDSQVQSLFTRSGQMLQNRSPAVTPTTQPGTLQNREILKQLLYLFQKSMTTEFQVYYHALGS